MAGDNITEEKKVREDILGGRFLTQPSPGDEVVISGLSGAFPDSNNVYEFRDNLYNKYNMVTPSHRWDYPHPEIPACTGTLPEIDKYDTGFFGVHERQSHSTDAMSRLFHEKAIESILDAGIHPSDLENTKTGVFVGVCFSESDKYWFFENLYPQTYVFTGAERAMIAHRVSYFLKLKGPSYTTDTACSSSLYALEHAYRAIRLGEIDNAIVGGANLCLHPFVSLQFSRLGVLSSDGACKAFDKMGNGYARSEAIGAVLLQKAKNARRIYATVLHAKTNCDGYKEQGITYPSGPAQISLLNDFYDECNVDRYSLSYLEAHGTGTFVGDPEEGLAIDSTLTNGRKSPLLIGSVKSNIGHSEPVSGMCSITKCIIGIEHGFIPPNIHFNTPRDEIKGLVEGRLKVVTEKIPFEDNRGLIGINSFGFGGGNCHILFRQNNKEKINNGIPKDNLPRLVCVSGRTEEAVTTLLDEISNNVLDAELISLVHNIFRKNVKNHLFRGYNMVSKTGKIIGSCKFSPVPESHKLYIIFGEMDNWYDVGNHLMELPVFENSIQRIQQHISERGINILNYFRKKSPLSNKYRVLASLAVQIGIAEIFNLLEIKPTGSFGYSFGELVSAYYAGTLSLEETINSGLIIDESICKLNGHYKSSDKDYQKQNINGGVIMNGNHILNGTQTEMEELKSTLKANKSTMMKDNLFQDLQKVLEKVNPLNGKRSSNAIKSSSQFIDYVKNNSLDGTNKSSIILKIGSSPVYARDEVNVLTFPDSHCKDYLVGFLKCIGSLYEYGCNPQVAKLYPLVDLPVSRSTRMISPYIKWKHNRNLFVPEYNQEIICNAERGVRTVKVQLTDHEWSYISGHIIDGRNLFPATGYLYLVWEAFALITGTPMRFMNVAFENCKFIRATAMLKKGYLQFNITIQRGTGNFEVGEGDSPVVTGRVYMLEDTTEIEDYPLLNSQAFPLKTKDIYKELRLRGYYYNGGFRAIQECDSSATRGFIKWEGNWVTFMDNMLQLKILQTDSRQLYVPTYIAKLVITPQKHVKWIDENFVKAEEDVQIPVFNNVSSGVISCGGVQICGLIASSINRKKNLAVPVLESYKFVPNIAALDIYQSVRVNIQIILENTLSYKVKAVELIDEFTRKDMVPLSPIIHSVIEDQPLIQPLVKILSKTPIDVTVDVEDKKLTNETNCLLVIASYILGRPEILKEALGSLSEDGFIISRESYMYNTSNNVDSGLTVLTIHRTSSETLLLLKKQKEAKQPTFIKISSSENFSWVPKVQEAMKQNKDNIVLYSENESNSGIIGLVNCLRREPNGKNIKGVFVTAGKLDLQDIYKNQIKNNMAVNIHKNGQWGTYRHLLLNELKAVESEHCFINSTVRGDLSSLKWIEGPLRHDMSVPSETELIYVYYAALNFRDVMTASGKVSADVITQDRREQEYVQGFEFSGRDIRGNRLMGMIKSGALSTIILADPYLTFKIPDTWTMEEGATVMVVYGTVVYAMIIRGQMKRGNTILIHSGTGGIGQAAIRFALHYGCKVYTTVGTQEKRDFLKKTFPQLKDHHIGNSRDESFEQMIYRETNGRGVDIVLNSLAEEKLVASVRCLAPGGKFLEIGKFDMANNKYLSLLLFQKEASIHGVMLDQLFLERPQVKAQITQIMHDGIKYGAIKPLNRSIFKVNEIEQAFRFMATGKHIGKVLVQVRKPEKELISTPKVIKFSGVPRYLCDAEKTYVIIGGLGGFGLELADWLILRGAKKVVLTTRKGISTGYQNLRIRIWRSYGTIVKISKADITTRSGCQHLIEQALELGPVDAIFNLAVVLADAIFENQTPETFQTSFLPKALATQYLDELTRKMCPTLSQFVVFSSVSCGRGNPGQTNYGMANSVMERICEKRKQDGYPSLAIQWGAVGEVGLVADMQEGHTEIAISGTLQQRISNCLQVLDTLLKQKEAAIVSSMVVAEKRGGADTADNIVDSVINILGLNDPKSVSLHSTLPELGMDSMTAVEIKQTLEREYEVFLTAKDMRTMTLSRLREMHEDKPKTNQEVEEKKGDLFGIEVLFRAIADESEINFPYIRLKSMVDEASSAPKVLLFPGLDNVAKLYESLSSKFNAHTVCIQLECNDQRQTIRDIAESVMPYVEKHLAGEQRFNVVAYSYGTLIALEVVSILESRGYTGQIICIDGAPLLMKEMVNLVHKESTQFFETAIVCQLLTFHVPPEIISAHYENIFKCNSWEERVTLGIDLVKKRVSISETHLRNVASGIYRRINTLKTYSPSFNKLKSDVKLCKPTVPVIQALPEDYSLSQLFEKPVEIQTCEGNHASILENVALAETIDSYFH